MKSLASWLEREDAEKRVRMNMKIRSVENVLPDLIDFEEEVQEAKSLVRTYVFLQEGHTQNSI